MLCINLPNNMPEKISILANDGIEQIAIDMLSLAGFTVSTEKVPQENLAAVINEKNYAVLLVRSATNVRKELIDACPGLRVIGRGGVGMDNIDVSYARERGLEVINTPAASSQSVAELVFAHLFSCARFLQMANFQLRTNGDKQFAELKKAYSKGIELRGKCLGIIGFGRIGQSVASYALGCGMQVIAYDPFVKNAEISLSIHGHGEIKIPISTVSLNELLNRADCITLHVPMPGDGKPLLGKEELLQTKKGLILVNAARGGVVDENALQELINSKHILAAGLDVFENEPSPDAHLLSNLSISVSPHTGASTLEAQERIGSELAEKIIAFFSR